MAFKMKGPTFYKSALKHGTHTNPQKTKYSDSPSDRSLHKHGRDGDNVTYIPVEEKPTKEK
jgi:hypothetical protein